MTEKIEFIESYIKTDDDSDYKWNDNHGVLIRCNECKYYQGVHGVMGHAPCSKWNVGGVLYNDYCSKAERKCRE